MEGEYVLEDIVAQLKDMLCIIDLEGNLRQVNPAGLGMIGLAPDEMLGKPWEQMFEEHSRPLSAEIIKHTIEDGTWGGEILFQRAGGEIFPVFLTTSLIPDLPGDLRFIAAHATDITHKKQLEDVARKRTEMTNKILHNAPIGIIAFDADGYIQLVNNTFLRMVGIPGQADILHRRIGEIEISLNPTLETHIQKSLRGESISKINFILGGDEEQRLSVNLTLIPLEGSRNRIDGVLGLFEDRTDKIKMEEKLLQADKLASMGYLAAGVAHEISNPLTGMYTIIERFREQAYKKGEEEEPFDRILNDIERIKGIISKLLAFASPSAQAPQNTRINDLIMNSVDFFKHQPVYRKIRIICELAEDLPVTFLDPNDLIQVIHNLFINSAQAMPSDGGEVHLHTKAADGEVIIEFEDTGSGITPENLPKIFDPFFTTKPVGTGTGLGLSVSYGIIQEYDGTIEVESTPDVGTKFTIKLPIKESSQVFDEG